MHRRVYGRLATLARELLAAGASVVVDAACNRRWQRDLLAAAAHETRTPLVWLEFDVPAAEAVERVIRRERLGTDASDASADVVRMQLAEREPIAADECGPAMEGGSPRSHATVTGEDVADPTGLVARLAGLTTRPTSAP
jgi:predicted kinase